MNRPDWNLFISGIVVSPKTDDPVMLRTVKCTCGKILTSVLKINNHYEQGHFDYGENIAIYSYLNGGIVNFFCVVHQDRLEVIQQLKERLKLAEHALIKARITAYSSPNIKAIDLCRTAIDPYINQYLLENEENNARNNR